MLTNTTILRYIYNNQFALQLTYEYIIYYKHEVWAKIKFFKLQCYYYLKFSLEKKKIS